MERKDEECNKGNMKGVSEIGKGDEMIKKKILEKIFLKLRKLRKKNIKELRKKIGNGGIEKILDKREMR